MSKYGQLTEIVTTSTALMAAAGAIIMLVRRKAKWEPLQENLGKGAKNIGALITAVTIGLVWASLRTDKTALTNLAIWSGVLTLIFLILYGILAGLYSYKKITIVDGKSEANKIIGGFFLTQEAKANIARAPQRVGREITLQEYFEGVQYNSDLVWTRPSLEVAKVLFILGYVGLIVCGTTALASTAMRMAIET